VRYVEDVLRKSGESEGRDALLEAGRLGISFEDMVVNAVKPARGQSPTWRPARACRGTPSNRGGCRPVAADAQLADAIRGGDAA
jgi:hypothetical protein